MRTATTQLAEKHATSTCARSCSLGRVLYLMETWALSKSFLYPPPPPCRHRSRIAAIRYKKPFLFPHQKKWYTFSLSCVSWLWFNYNWRTSCLTGLVCRKALRMGHLSYWNFSRILQRTPVVGIRPWRTRIRIYKEINYLYSFLQYFCLLSSHDGEATIVLIQFWSRTISSNILFYIWNNYIEKNIGVR